MSEISENKASSSSNEDPNGIYNNSTSATPAAGIPGGAMPVTGGETIAERYLAWEVRDARKQLRWTQIGSVALSVFTLGYLAYMTTRFNQALEPKAAAEVAQGIIAQQVEDRAREISDDLKQRVPKMISDFPDYAKQQLPQYRERLEAQIDTDLKRYLTQHPQELDKMVDEALEENKESIGLMLKEGKDPEVAQAVGEDLQKKMLQSMNDLTVGGESLQYKLDMTLTSLNDLEKRMAKLATNKNLTSSEKKARRAIALLSTSIDKKRQENGPLLPAIRTTL